MEGVLVALHSNEGSYSQRYPQRMTQNALQPYATGGVGLSLDSGTPFLPFLGNSLVQVGSIPNAATIADVTEVYTTDLRRQPDCSLEEDFILPTATTPNSQIIATVSGAQDYMHDLAGLTTKPDVFANGCDAQVLGLSATGNALVIGVTSSGAVIGAELASNGLYVTVSDFAANTSKSTQITSGQNPGYFSAASLRNNGTMDLVETSLTDPATHKAATTVLLGNGDGTFKPAVYYDVSDNGLGLFTIDDVNGDGVPDIVELTTSAGTVTGVTTLIGKGDGTFTVGPTSTLSGVPSDQPVTGDFNNDGKKDLLVGGTVLFGSGNGGFTVGPTNAALANIVNYLFPSAVGDLRNNGKLDVVATNQGGSVSIFYGNGDGTFTAGPTYAALPDYMQVTIDDLDGDGNLDIVLGTSTAGLYTIGGYDTPLPMYQVLMGRGDGTFVDSQAYLDGSYPQAGGPQIASADFNGDGKLDLLAFQDGNGITPNELILLPGNGKGNLGTPVTSPVTMFPKQMLSVDMNGDGKPDAVMVGGLQLGVLFNQGNGKFGQEQDYTLPMSAVSVAVGDFNGDGLMDVAVGASDGTAGGVYVLLGKANHTLAAPVQIDSSLDPTGLTAGSLIGDGRSDLVVADQGNSGQQIDGALHVYLGDADGTFTAKTAPTTTASFYTVAALGDLNKDGKLDLLVAGRVPPATSGYPATPTMYTLLGNGDGTFQTAKALALADADGVGATSIALADFNKSGNLGAVLGNPLDYTEVLLGNGDGTLTETALALGQRPNSVAAADLLGNGYPEVLVGQSNTYGQGALAVFLNSTVWTAATTTITPTVSVSASPSSITTAQSTKVTITVSGGSGNPTATGSVTLASGSYTSAATTLASGSAVISVPGSSLAVGANTLTATYTPDSANSTVYNSATGTGSVTVTTATPGFSLTNSGNISVSPGAMTANSSTITATPSNGFTGAIALTCAITPAAASDPATCTLSPASVTISGTAAQTSTLTITSTAATMASLDRSNPDPTPGQSLRYAAGGISLACVFLFVLPARRRRLRRMFSIILLFGITGFGIVSCGGSGSKTGGGGGMTNPGTTAGTYTVTVTGTMGSITQTTTVSLTVN